MLEFKHIEKLIAESRALQAQHQKVLAGALTSLAFDARKETQKRLPEWLKLTRNFLPQSVVYKSATPETMLAKVGFLPRADFMHLLEEGGTRKPNTSSSLAVPVQARRTARGAIPASERPKEALAKRNTFLMVTNEGLSGIWRNLRGDLQLLYVFKKYTQYRTKKTDFYSTVGEVVQNNTEAAYAKNFDRYMGKG